MTKAQILVVFVLLITLASCGSDQQTARFEGWKVDRVGQSEAIGPDGQKDVQIALPVEPGGSIIRILVRNTDGQASNWDTVPNNVNWAVGVADRQTPNELLNRPDGSVVIPVNEKRELLLFLADNGAFRGGQTSFEALVTFQGGREASYDVER
ncbi:MAG: hypothetical protein EHM61_03240 [Acidobacteria bacterium]|nr:MAG: hypothetical protein EHM61_03240 [Acidobacteriota bacterium]